MKKLFSLALVALFASAAQAATVDWSKASSVEGATVTTVASDSSNAAGSGTLSVSSTTSWTIAFHATLSSSLSSNGSFGSILYVTTSEGELSGMRTSNALAILPVVSGSVTWNSGASTLSSGTHEFALSYDGSGTLTLYVDGDAFSSMAYTPSDTVTYYYGQDADEGQKLSVRASYTADVYAVTGSTYSNLIVQTVPEPTVLALLALGVAGMALKRRVA